MTSGDESIPSSVSYSSSSSISNVPSHVMGTELDPSSLELDKLSSNLGQLLTCPDYDYRDAEIEVDGITVGIHRCILAARSEFFHELFKNARYNGEQGNPPKYILSELIPHARRTRRIGIESFMAVMNYMYAGKVSPPAVEVSTCADKTCTHDSCGPAVNHAVEVMRVSATFQIQHLKAIFQERLLVYAEKAFAEDVVEILNVASVFHLNPLLTQCVQRLARSDIDEGVIEKELPSEIARTIISLRAQGEEDEDWGLKRKIISKKVQRALDSHDVALLKLLLQESNFSLDDAHALHYAVAYCSPSVVKEVLNLGNADVNLKDPRGHTVLHVAARRKDPSIIIGLLERGASAFDTTRDGLTAAVICKRLTRLKDFNGATNEERLCIDVLERGMSRKPSPDGNSSSMASATANEDLCMSLLLFENRVAMARRFFPLQARLAMEVAHADSTTEFEGSSSMADLRGADLKEMPPEEIKKLQLRLQALQKTVDTGRRFFPNCSEYLDRLAEDESLGTLVLETGEPEEQRKKKMRFMELKEEVAMAFIRDKPEPSRSATSSASSSPKLKARRK